MRHQIVLIMRVPDQIHPWDLFSIVEFVKILEE